MKFFYILFLEMKTKIESWETSIKKALDTKIQPPVVVSTPTAPPNTSNAAPTNAAVATPSTQVASSQVSTQIRFKSDTSKVFKMPKLPIIDLKVFTNFEEDLGYKKFYDLVFSRLSEMVPSRFARRTLHRYLRSIIDDDLLLNFIWDNKLSRMFLGMEQKQEMVKFSNFQNLLFALINHHKAVNFPNGLKWSELEQFLKNQLRNARERAKAKVMRSRVLEEEMKIASLEKSEDAMDTSEDQEMEKSMSETESADSPVDKLDKQKMEESRKMEKSKVQEKAVESKEKPEIANKRDQFESSGKVEKEETKKAPAQKPDEPKRITINPQQIKELLNKAVVHDASKLAQIKIAKKPDSEEHPKSIVITKGKTVQIVKKIVTAGTPLSVKPNLVLKKMATTSVQKNKEVEKAKDPEKQESEKKSEESEKKVEEPAEIKQEKEDVKEEPESEVSRNQSTTEPLDFVSCE
jgi:hypothetical protein